MEALNGTFTYEGKLKGEQLRSEVALFERAMDRAQKFSMDLIKADIDERCVRIQESVARAVATAVLEGLDKSGASAEQKAIARDHITTRLRLLSGGQDPARAASAS